MSSAGCAVQKTVCVDLLLVLFRAGASFFHSYYERFVIVLLTVALVFGINFITAVVPHIT